VNPIKRFHGWIDKVWRDDRYTAAYEYRRFLPWKLESLWIALAAIGQIVAEFTEWTGIADEGTSYKIGWGALVAAILLRIYMYLRFMYFASFTKNSEEIMKIRREDGRPD